MLWRWWWNTSGVGTLKQFLHAFEFVDFMKLILIYNTMWNDGKLWKSYQFYYGLITAQAAITIWKLKLIYKILGYHFIILELEQSKFQLNSIFVIKKLCCCVPIQPIQFYNVPCVTFLIKHFWKNIFTF